MRFIIRMTLGGIILFGAGIYQMDWKLMLGGAGLACVGVIAWRFFADD